MNDLNSKLGHTVSPYGLFMIFLNLAAVVVALLTFKLSGFSDSLSETMIAMDTLLSVVLLADFVWRFSQIEPHDRKKFLFPWGIIDFLGCLPAIPILRIFRIVRIFRLTQMVRQVGWKSIVIGLKQHLAASSLWAVITMTIPTIIISGWWIFKMEEAECLNQPLVANICSIGDGIWWSFVTVTTVGYGDHFPVSNGGRILAGVLMTIGVGLFGILTSYLATIFIRQNEEQVESDLSAELVDVKQELAEIKALLIEKLVEN
ncbi:MAG: voltage-gated potassium channel [Cellvibrionaceae bacterium]|jgi:voltage-gated potassium channel